eukprot:gene12654-15886_t
MYRVDARNEVQEHGGFVFPSSQTVYFTGAGGLHFWVDLADAVMYAQQNNMIFFWACARVPTDAVICWSRELMAAQAVLSVPTLVLQVEGYLPPRARRQAMTMPLASPKRFPTPTTTEMALLWLYVLFVVGVFGTSVGLAWKMHGPHAVDVYFHLAYVVCYGFYGYRYVKHKYPKLRDERLEETRADASYGDAITELLASTVVRVGATMAKTVEDRKWYQQLLSWLTFIANISAFGTSVAAYVVPDADTADELSKISQIIITLMLSILSIAALKSVFGGLHN